MIIDEVVKKIGLEVVAGSNSLERDFDGVYIGDLLSIVMSKAEKNNLWITIQTHLNIIAVATLVELSGIIIVENMEVQEDTIKKANELGIPILKTKLSAYDVACKIKEICD